MSEEKKQRLREYQKNYREIKKLKLKKLTFFSFHCIRHRSRSIAFRRNEQLKVPFIKVKDPLILME